MQSKNIKKLFSFFGLLFLINPMLVTAAAKNLPMETTHTEQQRITQLKSELKNNPNFLQYTEYKMLQSKYGTSTPNNYEYGAYSLVPSGKSPLSQEYSGVNLNSESSDFTGSLDILTGQRAMNESAQIDSIGFDRTTGGGIVSAAGGAVTPNERMLASALELYFNDKKKYPETLAELAPNYIARIPEGFTYKVLAKGKNYNLFEGSFEPAQQDVSEVKALEIKTHPWQSMIQKQPTVPEIFSLVPADDLVFYFRDIEKFSELEQEVKNFGKPLESIYGLNNSSAIKEKIFKRLGIRDIPTLKNFIQEAALVSYDLDAYPNTDYALILKIKSSLLQTFVSNYIAAPKENHASVGDYYVIATDPIFLQTIKNTQTNPQNSLAKKLDFSYALSILESNFDGIVYVSDSFIGKLTSPAYRINARRRNTGINSLENLQYVVFAYRDITKNWPKNFQQIINEGYIKPNTVKNFQDYSISEKGIVTHKEWGSIYNITPINRVPINSVSSGEVRLYNNFKEGYQNYWREYIDPIGVAVTVGDQIKFHTIILPLIEKSEYNYIKDISGKEGVVFDFLKNPDRIPAIAFNMKISVDDAIYAYYKSTGKYEDSQYTQCTSQYYNSNNWTNPNRKTVDETCKFEGKSFAEAVVYVKKQVADSLGWKEKTLPFDFLGNEINISAGENLSFNFEDLSQFDVAIGVELKDQAMAKKFLDHIFAWYEKSISDSNSRGSFFGGFLKVESNKPIKNTYNNVEFYLVPLGFTNFYYSFINNRFYLTVSQSAMNNIIDGSKSKLTKWPNYMQRIFDYLGDEMNVGLIVDNLKLQKWLRGAIQDQWMSYAGKKNLRQIKNYYFEALTLAQSLPNFSGNLENVKDYYPKAPTSWFEGKIYAKDGKAYIEVGQQYELNKIELGSYYGYNNNDNNSIKQEKIDFSEVTNKFNVENTLANWQKLKGLGIGLNLTKEGLDVRVAFTNTVNNKQDSRVKSVSKNLVVSNNQYIIFGGGLLILALLIVFLWRYLKNKKHLKILSQTVRSENNFSENITVPHPEIPKELQDYVNYCVQKNMDKEIIKENLASSGWSEEIINKVLNN